MKIVKNCGCCECGRDNIDMVVCIGENSDKIASDDGGGGETNLCTFVCFDCLLKAVNLLED